MSGGNLVYTGATSDDYVHFYESETNQGIRYNRYRLEWDMLELKGGNRHFHINDNDTVEMQKVGDKWLTLNASDEDKERALAEYSKRMRHAMSIMQLPIIKNINNTTIADSIMPTLPENKPFGNRVFEIQYEFDKNEPLIIDKNARPNVSPDVCPLVEYITGKKGEITEDDLDKIRTMYSNDDIQIGDTIYTWDMDGWHAMAGRAGEAIFRGNEYIASKLLKMS